METGESMMTYERCYKYDTSLDKKMLRNSEAHFGVDDLDFSCIEGRFELDYKNILWDMCYIPGNTEKLFITLSGGGFRKPGDAFFIRWSYQDTHGYSQLCIEDPMYKKFRYELPTGWFWGTKDEDYCKYLAEIIDFAKCKLGAKEVIVWSSSAGGTAAIRVGNILQSPEVKIVAFNSQLDLRIFDDDQDSSNLLSKITGIDISKDPLKRNERIINDMLESNNRTKYVILQNVCSETDEAAANALSKKKGIPTKLGINKLSNNIFLWLYEAIDWQNSHKSQDWRAFFPLLFHTIERLWDNESVDDTLINDILYVWYDRFRTETKMNYIKNKAEIYIIPSNVKVAMADAEKKEEKEVVIQKRSSNFNYWQYNLDKETFYSLEFLCTSDNVDEYTAILYDFRYNQKLWEGVFEIGKKNVINFQTGSNYSQSEDVRFLIYAGVAGKTFDKEVVIKSLSISKGHMECIII